MPQEPLYTPERLRSPAYQLRYTWTGWPSTDTTFPPCPDDSFFADLAGAWEGDGMRLLEYAWADDQISILSSTEPDVSPVTLASRTKGRLQHALREAGRPVEFCRRFGVHAVGKNRRPVVERYVAEQVERADLADPDFAETLEAFTVEDGEVDLSEPARTKSASYWYNVHVVLGVRDRCRITDESELETLRDASFGVAERKGFRLSVVSVMPDHLHAALGARPEQTPAEVAVAFMNGLAEAVGMAALWEDSYYVGTFGEYDMDAVR